MATKRLLGILKDANGIPLANTTIRFSSTSTRSVLNTVNTDYLTNSEGAYDFSVEYGVYTIQIKREDEINFRTVCANAYVYSEMVETLELLIKAQKHVQEIDETIIQEMLTILASANAAALSASDSADIASTKAAESSASASVAKTSADNSAASASVSESHSIVSGQKALEAKNSADASAASAASANASAQSALASKTTAEEQATIATDKAAAAALSEQNALASKQSAENSASTATTKAAEAVAARDSAIASASAASSYKDSAEAASSEASLSAATATTKATEASNSAASAELSKNTATTKAAEASASADTAQGYKDTAVLKASEAAQSAVEAAQSAALAAGALIEAGSADLSSGVFPAPIKDAQGNNRSCFWKVIVGGSVSGDVYGIGDSLVYSKEMAGYYKIDNTESVSSVNGKQGVVVLNKADVGLANVDNTSDLNKPVSTATQYSLDLKVDKTRTVNSKPLSDNIVLTASDVGAAPASHVGSGGTSHATATTSVDGFMSKADKSKLDAIAVSANNYVHPASGVSPGTYKAVTVDGNGHVTGGSNPTTVDGYGITDAAKTHSSINFGGSATAITTADFITQLTDLGAFNSMHWCTKVNWTYAYNNYITDTGVGVIQLAGCTVEVIGGSTSTYTIRIHTSPTVSIEGAVPNADFIYVNHGPGYSPKWHRIYSTEYKPTPADIGAASATELSTAIAGRVPIAGRIDWSSQGVIGCTVGMLSWKNFGNGHTIFDASAGTSPDGTVVDKNNSHIAWSATHPTLMGWNGTNTYGVRVDSARVADISTTADRLTGVVSTNGQDLKIHDKRAMVGAADGHLFINYQGDFQNSVNIQGELYTQKLNTLRHIITHDGSDSYANAGLTTQTSDGSSVRIALHRTGHSAVALRHSESGHIVFEAEGAGSRANLVAGSVFAENAQPNFDHALTRKDYVDHHISYPPSKSISIGGGNDYYLVKVTGYGVYSGFTVMRDIHQDFEWAGSLLLNIKGVGMAWGGMNPTLNFEVSQSWGVGVSTNGTIADIRTSETAGSLIYLYLKGNRTYSFFGEHLLVEVLARDITEPSGKQYPGVISSGYLSDKYSFSSQNLDQFISYGLPCESLSARTHYRVYHEGHNPTPQSIGALPTSVYSGQLASLTTSGLWQLDGSSTDTPTGSSIGDHVLHANWDNNAAFQLYLPYVNPEGFAIRRKVGSYLGWSRIYHEEFKPTPAAIGAQPATSDIRVKSNIHSLGPVLDKLMLIEPKTFNMEGRSNTCIGTIAQDWEKDFPEVILNVPNPGGSQKDPLKGIDALGTIGILLKAIQELKAEVEELKNR